MALRLDSADPIQCFDVLGLTSDMFVNKHSDFLALAFKTGVDVICKLRLLSVTPSGVYTIAASRMSFMFCCSQHLTAC